MNEYIYQHKEWPNFQWQEAYIASKLPALYQQLGRILGHMEVLGFSLSSEASLRALTLEIVKSSEIENEILDYNQVRSSIARKLNIQAAGLVEVKDRYIDGTVEMMLDATQNYDKKLIDMRLFNWHAALFPSGMSGMSPITVGTWRDDISGPMQVISGYYGREKIHFQAPDAAVVAKEMKAFLNWFNQDQIMDSLIKAAIAHLWFITIHPFEDGNGRIARAIGDLQLARIDKCKQRFYSLSAQIRKERKQYYEILEETQKGSLDMTQWLDWFTDCLARALEASEASIQDIIQKAKFWEEHSKTSINDRQRLMLNKLLDGEFFGKLNTAKWAKLAKCSHDTALRDIKDLMDKKILLKEPGEGKNTSYCLIIKQ